MPETLKPLEKHRKDFTTFSILIMDLLVVIKAYQFLLGLRPILAHNYDEGNISLDQKLAEYHGAATRFPSMTLGVEKKTS